MIDLAVVFKIEAVDRAGRSGVRGSPYLVTIRDNSLRRASMKREEFDIFVARLERYAAAHPRRYRLRVGLLAALGYAYLFLIVAVTLSLIGWVIISGHVNYLMIKLLWIPAVLVLIIMQSLWIKFPRPEGQEIRAADAPELFQLIKELRAAMRAPGLHRILITNDFNAAVVQVPRLGVFGWQENYLLLGLPLLHALSAGEFRAVLAHELGHVSGNHGRFAAWIYRVRQTWLQILARMQNEGRHGSFVFERFLAWYAPFFNAYSFVLARRQEYEADLQSVALAGREHAAAALINLEIKGKLLEREFWPALLQSALDQPKPPRELYGQMFTRLGAGVPAETARDWLKRALKEPTGSGDTHPALADRLALMGFSRGGGREEEQILALLADAREQPAATAAGVYLGRANDELTRKLNMLWNREVAEKWGARHESLRQAKQNLDRLEAKAGGAELTPEEAWERAVLTAQTRGIEAAIPLCQSIVRERPEHAGAQYLLGQALLAHGDERGVDHIGRAMEQDSGAVIAGCELVYHFLRERGETARAESFAQRAQRQYDLIELARHERNDVAPTDEFEAHGLAREDVKAIRDQLEKVDGLSAAYLVKKKVRHFPESPLFVLGVVSRTPWYQVSSARNDRALVSLLARHVRMPGETLFVALTGERKKLGQRLKEIGGAEVYREFYS